LVVDVSHNGIVLTGGGSRIWGFDQLITERTGVACSVADDAESCVAFGCGKSLKWINQMQEGTINIARKKLLEE
jgi:rod shape-determining protein MreB